MGAIMSVGVASANSILLVTFAREQQLAGRTAFEAAIDAGHTRIRPVLMTAAAMIVGMIPMAIGGAGEEQNAALARAVIGGLLFATPTTLLIVPPARPCFSLPPSACTGCRPRPKTAARLQQRANGPPLWCSGYGNSAGSKAAPPRFVEYRWAEGRTSAWPEIAAEFVKLKVDVVVTYGTPGTVRGKARDLAYTDCLRPVRGPTRHRPRCESGATGWQRHGPVESARPISRASDSNFCARLFLASAGWRSWPMSAIPLPCWR